MKKVFVNSDKIKDGIILIDDDNMHHIINVLRMKNKQKLNVCDKQGNEFITVIKDIKKNVIICEIIDKVCENVESKLKITLFQAIPKSSKMEFVIQKCVELGVFEIIPIITQRTIVKLNRDNVKRRIERWNKISENACKQSGRTYIPYIHFPIEFSQAILKAQQNDLNIIPAVDEKNIKLKSVIRNNIDRINSVGIFIGPEGGFDQKEISYAVSNKIMPVTLGPRILRTETAGMAVVSILLYESGDIGG